VNHSSKATKQTPPPAYLVNTYFRLFEVAVKTRASQMIPLNRESRVDYHWIGYSP